MTGTAVICYTTSHSTSKPPTTWNLCCTRSCCPLYLPAFRETTWIRFCPCHCCGLERSLFRFLYLIPGSAYHVVGEKAHSPGSNPSREAYASKLVPVDVSEDAFEPDRPEAGKRVGIYWVDKPKPTKTNRAQAVGGAQSLNRAKYMAEVVFVSICFPTPFEESHTDRLNARLKIGSSHLPYRYSSCSGQ